VAGQLDAALDDFLELYAAGRYFDAHEVLEGAWHRSDDAPMPFVQGLIQWAVALEHHRRGNARGARALLERALANLAAAPPGELGLDLSACRAAARRLLVALGEWEDGGARPDVGCASLRIERKAET
jgi:predicted metal-dependent hydrolase